MRDVPYFRGFVKPPKLEKDQPFLGHCVPERIRTSNLPLRRGWHYPVMLRGRAENYNKKYLWTKKSSSEILGIVIN